MTYNPQAEAATWVAVIVTLPSCCAWLLVNLFIAPKAILKLGVATSMAIILMVFVMPDEFLKASCQHVPQAAEPWPVTAGAPPMLGKWGREPKVVKPLVKRPLGPSEQATVASDPAALS